jgi:hypothetical protein
MWVLTYTYIGVSSGLIFQVPTALFSSQRVGNPLSLSQEKASTTFLDNPILISMPSTRNEQPIYLRFPYPFALFGERQ